MNLKQKTIHGLKWSYVSTISNAIMQIGYIAVMARLLEPAAFGLVAMAQVVLRFGSYFAQIGMGQALIQKKELSKGNIRAAFTSSIFLGFIFFVIIYFSAPLSIYIFNDVGVIPIIRVMALSLVLTGLSTTALSLLRRSFRFKELAIAESSSYVIGYVGVGIIFALLGFGVWSLVFAALTQSFVITVISYLLVRHSLIFSFEWKHYKKLFSFGSKVSLISFLEFIGANISTILIADLLGPIKLGFFNRAHNLSNNFIQNINRTLFKVFYPVISIFQSDHKKLKLSYLKITLLSGFFLFPIGFGMAISGREIILVVLGAKWNDSIFVFQLLSIAVVINSLNTIDAIFLEAAAILNDKLKIQFFYDIIIFIFIYLFIIKGINGVGIAIFLSVVLRKIAYLYYIKKLIKISSFDMIKIFIPTFQITLMVSTIIFLVRFILILSNFSNGVILLFEILTGAITLICSIKLKLFKNINYELSEIIKNSSINKKLENSLINFIN